MHSGYVSLVIVSAQTLTVLGNGNVEEQDAHHGMYPTYVQSPPSTPSPRYSLGIRSHQKLSILAWILTATTTAARREKQRCESVRYFVTPSVLNMAVVATIHGRVKVRFLWMLECGGVADIKSRKDSTQHPPV